MAVLERLACDPRMKVVWDELNKRRREDYRSTDEPLYPSKLPGEIASWKTVAAAWRERAAEYRELGDESIARAYDCQAAVAEARPDTRSPVESAADVRHQRALAVLLVQSVSAYLDGSRTVSQREVDNVVSGFKDKGKEAVAAAFERHAADPRNSRFIVKRHRTDARLEAFVETIGRTMTELFGNPLYGVIAIIANVAFELTGLNRQKIRAILDAR